MKKKILVLICLICLSLSVLLCGCGSNPAKSSIPPMSPQDSYSEGAYDWGSSMNRGEDGSDFNLSDIPEEPEYAAGRTDTKGLLDTMSNAKGLKLIYTGYLSMETRVFDEDFARLTALVTQTGSYVSSSNMENRSNDTRYLHMTVRVPKEQFSSFMDQAGEIGHKLDVSVDSQDVTPEYTDTELRLSTLRNQHQRLSELLKDAATLEDIVSLEMRLSEVEGEIESLEGRLRGLDSYIEYSTVNIDLSEVKTLTQVEDPEDSLGDRIATGWYNSLTNLRTFGGDLLVFLVTVLPVLLVLLIPASLVVGIVLLCAFAKKKKKARKV